MNIDLNKRPVLWGIVSTGILFVLLAILFDQVIMPIYTSRGQEMELPDVVEMPYEKAYQLLKEKGFSVTREPDVYDSMVPKNTVIHQSPRSFTIVKKGRRVALTVSAGIAMVQVPSVVGLSEKDARSRLRENGLQCLEEDIRYEISRVWERGVIANQSIMEGESVPEGTRILLVISSGDRPDQFIVPDVTLKGLNEARNAIEKAGLRVGRITFEINKNLVPNTVISQSIPAGAAATIGEQIHLKVSQLEETWGE